MGNPRFGVWRVVLRRLGLALLATIIALVAMTPPPASAAPTNPQETLPDEQKLEILTQWAIARYQASIAEFCWKGGYDRGLGTGIDTCPPGTEKNGLLCYPLCREGFYGNGPVCWQTCAPGWHDDGAFCRFEGGMQSRAKNSYGRGGGYALWDKAKCAKDSPQGCEQNGALIYPLCKSGYAGNGPVCWEICPAGQTDDGAFCRIGGSVAKQSYGRGAGTPMVCPPGKVNEGGLCYTPCQPGHTGEARSCRRDCPSTQKVNCGLGCAWDQQTCSDVTVQQVSASLHMLLNAVKLFAGSNLASGSKSLHEALVKGAGATAALIAKNVIKGLATAIVKKLGVVAVELAKFLKEEAVALVLDRASTKMATTVFSKGATESDVRDFMMSLDPTGIADVVKAFDKPSCPDPSARPPMFAHLYDQVIGAAYAGNREHIDVLVDRGARVDFKYWPGGAGSASTDSASLGSLRLGGSGAMAFNPTRNHVDVFGRGEDGSLHAFLVPSGSWVDTVIPNAYVGSQSEMAAVYEPQRKDSGVFFRGSDGYLNYVYRTGAGWGVDSQSFRASQVAGAIAAFFDPQENHSTVFFLGADNRVHRYHVTSGGWQHQIVGALNESGGSIAVAWDPIQRIPFVVHRNVVGNMESAWPNPYVTGGWDGGPREWMSSKVGGDVQIVFPPGSKTPEVVFKGEDGNLQHWGNRGGKWVLTNLGAYGGPVQGKIGAAWSTKKQGLEVVFVGTDKQAHYDFLKDTTWTHATF